MSSSDTSQTSVIVGDAATRVSALVDRLQLWALERPHDVSALRQTLTDLEGTASSDQPCVTAVIACLADVAIHRAIRGRQSPETDRLSESLGHFRRVSIGCDPAARTRAWTQMLDALHRVTECRQPSRV
jgi:hypothetical protein